MAGLGRLVPKNYKGDVLPIDESISLGKFPTYQWNSDAYTNWLTQNAINNEVRLWETIASPLSTLLGMSQNIPINNTTKQVMTDKMSAGDISQGVSGLLSVSDSILHSFQSFYEARLLPNKTAGTNTR